MGCVETKERCGIIQRLTPPVLQTSALSIGYKNGGKSPKLVADNLNLTLNAYMAQTMSTLSIFDVNWGLFKSAIFAVLIATVGCFKGYQVRGGAASVGQATTSAVVTGIFLVILVDSILAVILRYWRP